ncbi:hypothetical protein Tco_0101684, partial [Tanacetum coccineum]
SRQVSRWPREEEILLCQCWDGVSENNEIRADRNEDSFWGQIMEDFNKCTFERTRTKNMLTGKWSSINDDCKKFNAIYKHLERKSRENEADHIEPAKTKFSGQSKGRRFLLDHTEIFVLDETLSCRQTSTRKKDQIGNDGEHRGKSIGVSHD